MKNTRLIKLMNGIPEAEYNLVSDVLIHYDMDIKDISKIGSVYKIRSSDGYRCLKRLKHGKGKSEKVYFLTQSLIENGFYNVANFITTKSNKIYVRCKDYYFYMTEWIQGCECNLLDFTELKKCIELMAQFHITSTDKDILKYLRVEGNLKHWPSIFARRCSDLLRFNRIAGSKRIKSIFDKKYGELISHYYKQGLLAIELLDRSNYKLLSKRAQEDHCICHDNFYAKNLLIDNKGCIYLVNLDNTVIDLRMNELGKLMRRILIKEAYAWDFNYAKEIIDTYSSVSPISREELAALLSIIIFPNKFWKLGRKRYDKDKLWSEEKYNNKLEKLIRFMDRQQKFVHDFIMHYNIEINICEFNM